jgi:hypothetical protein
VRELAPLDDDPGARVKEPALLPVGEEQDRQEHGPLLGREAAVERRTPQPAVDGNEPAFP